MHEHTCHPCRCGIADWLGLRLALHLTQSDLAAALYCSRWVIIRAEAAQHHCPRAATVRLLHDQLHHPKVLERLADAGYDPYSGETTVRAAAPAHMLRIGPLAVRLAQ